MSKQLEKLQSRHPEKIRDWYKDSDGYWIDLQYGWQLQGTHTVHEWNVRDALDMFKAVEPCDCLECRTKGEQWEGFDIETGEKIIHHREEAS